MNKLSFVWFLFSFTVLFCLNSCQNKSAKDNRTTIFLADNLQNTVEKIPLSNAISSMEVVPLETNPECMITEINKIILTDRDIIIYHHFKQPLLRFSRDGKFLNKIGNIGNGPQECNLIAGVTLDELKREIYLNLGDGITAGFMVYDLEGKFKRKVTFNTYEQFTTLSPDFFYVNDLPFFQQNLPVLNPQVKMWNFALLDTLLHPVKTFTNPCYDGREDEINKNHCLYDGWANYYVERNPVNIYKNELKIIFQGTDTIYQYDPASQTFAARYTLELGERPSFSEARQWIKDYSFFTKLWLSDFFDTQDYLYMNIGKDKNNYLAQFDKANGTIEVLKDKEELVETQFPTGWIFKRRSTDFPGLYNDLCGYPEFFTPSQSNNGKYWTKAIDAYQFLTDIKKDTDQLEKMDVKDPGTRSKLFQLTSGLTENSNPVLFIATIK